MLMGWKHGFPSIPSHCRNRVDSAQGSDTVDRVHTYSVEFSHTPSLWCPHTGSPWAHTPSCVMTHLSAGAHTHFGGGSWSPCSLATVWLGITGGAGDHKQSASITHSTCGPHRGPNGVASCLQGTTSLSSLDTGLPTELGLHCS